MQTSDFDFTFPENLIASHPLPKGESRMLVLDRIASGAVALERSTLHSERAAVPEVNALHAHTRNLIDYLRAGDALVLNDTKVLRARLIGKSAGGDPVEALLLAPISASQNLNDTGETGRNSVQVLGVCKWEAMVKPGKRFRIGDRIIFSEKMVATVTAITEAGTRALDFAISEQDFLTELEVTGRIPLPPYIKRDPSEADVANYQSVFAEIPGSVAAPTASLHLSETMLKAIQAKGVKICKVTLHVGAGTFKPVQSENLAGHDMHSERYSLTKETAEALNAVRSSGGKVWAVGTTVARVLETCALGTGEFPFEARAGETRIFIHPGYVWKGVDGLLTNFHWPRSTLFMLVCSLLGTERAKRAYQEAFDNGFRLFSYGDAMLIRN